MCLINSALVFVFVTEFSTLYIVGYTPSLQELGNENWYKPEASIMILSDIFIQQWCMQLWQTVQCKKADTSVQPSSLLSHICMAMRVTEAQWSSDPKFNIYISSSLLQRFQLFRSSGLAAEISRQLFFKWNISASALGRKFWWVLRVN